MRDYLSPAKRIVNQAIARTISVKSLGSKRGLFITTGVASILAVSLVALIVVKTNASQASVTSTVTSTKTATPNEAVFSTPEITDNVTTEEAQPMATQSSSNESTSNTDTKITINNEDVPVPENGTVHRTIQNENGTTNVTVNTSTGTTSNQSTSSTSMNVNTSTFSHTTNMNISSQ